MAVSNKPARHLKLLVEETSPSPAAESSSDASPLAPIARAFQFATGWEIHYTDALSEAGETWSAAIGNGNGESAGRLVLNPAKITSQENRGTSPSPPSPAVELEQVRPLALAIASLLTEQNRLRHAVWEREAELAAGVPVAARPDDEQHLAQRLAAVLKGGADAVGCQAAALYVLDETTTTLKLRASHNLPPERLLEPARPLRGAMADLEALVGHAVVLQDTSILPHWRCPENYPAAVCVPVAGSSMPLGTLWIYSSQGRDFTSEETNLVEIIAGRIAADLEREMLLTQSTRSRRREQLLEAAARWQACRLPSVTPLLEDFEIAGWAVQADGIGGDFYDWSVLADGRLAIVLGDAQGRLMEAGLSAAALQAAIKSHGSYPHEASGLLARVNETLWTTSAGDQFASMFYGLIDPASGRLEFSLAGSVAGLHVRRAQREVVKSNTLALGADPETRFATLERQLKPGDFLVLLSEGAQNSVDEAGLRIGELAISSLATKNLGDSADGMLAKIRRLIDRGSAGHSEDMTVLVVKRRS